MNLNEAKLPVDWPPEQKQVDYSVRSGEPRAYFKELTDRLIEHVIQADAIVGCVAWFTNERILSALSTLKGVSIIVQKEDFLRPDGPSSKQQLRNFYAKLPSLYRSQFDGLVRELNYASLCSDPMGGVRCAGIRGGYSRCHHKFVVFCALVEGCLRPYGVWTGSFNFTNNAERSFENAVYIENHIISQAYFDEYSQIAALSEPLDWTHEYVEPEWRIGS
jgi:hypothetical protein